MTDVLTRSFLAALSNPASVADEAALMAALTASVTAARARFPGVEFEASAVGRHLGEKVVAEADPLAALARLRTEELCLVCACLAGNPRALQLFDAAYLAPVAERLRRSGLAAEVVADARQRIAGSLLVADSGGTRRLATYSGRGDLAGWLYVAIAREARRLAGREARFTAADDLELADERIGGDLELAHLKATYGEAFRRSFHTALAELDEQARNLLRQHLLDGLSIDQIAALQRVHRATAARRLVRVREDLALRTRALLVQDLGLSERESDSVLRLVRSQLDLSLTRVLGAGA
ncbi:sigma factor-like helix-turn-helix DNA-binding protein [Nannocystis sp. SCPEA4]|uniref:sigma factor-like helix-turn-helix DNA-binding protein n=1 Tax=Nannocystis sp. SCPEA4 TaxID=2996787 RepID=UPI0022719865|nr:sigma factor-like helix-turn-helix DNA-binding protein [Nannocystis sp. SCPEA4]MCY1055380.1 transcriptional regulator [Nannocystis sp. SCPEA4]